METSEEWSGLGAALNELGVLRGENNVQDRHRRPGSMSGGPNSSKRQHRRLFTNQFLNRPDILTEVDIDGVQDGSFKKTPSFPDCENSENSFSRKSYKLGKIHEPKSGLSYCTIKSIPMNLPESKPENNCLNVLKMNSEYITGVTIGTFESSKDSSVKSQSNAIPSCSTSKPCLTVSLRYHHLRPYEIPRRREERVRTTSETAENGTGIPPLANVDLSLNNHAIGKSSYKASIEKIPGCFLKSKSLENVRMAENDVPQVPASEMDLVSTKIQHLHVE